MKLVDLLMTADNDTPVRVSCVDSDGNILHDAVDGREMWPYLLQDVHGWSFDSHGVFTIYVYVNVVRY